MHHLKKILKSKKSRLRNLKIEFRGDRRMRKIGDRIGAVLSANKETVNLLGYGIYAEDEIPPNGILHIIGAKNPKLQLDNGKMVWGYQCCVIAGV